MLARTRAPDVGVYVHLPFCERICPYCDFAVEPAGRLAPELERRYLEWLEVELDFALAGPARPAAGRVLRSVYFGGGTPSLFEPASIERLLGTIRKRFAGEPEEVTLELNPGTGEIGRVPGFRAAGVTRLSVGVQSLRDETLRKLGRAHTAAEALSGLEACLRGGFESVSTDLIFGAPGQSESEFLSDLERVIRLGVPHISAYALTIEPETPFARARARGKLALPDEDTLLAAGRRLRVGLAASGFTQYEISSFARPGHASRHNQRYWLRRDVLGIGVGAASLVESSRWKNLRARSEWEARLADGRLPVAESESLTEQAARRETLFLGFRRLAGISRAAYLRRFAEAPERRFGAEIRELRELELIEDRKGRIRLTERGILFADEVFLRFVAC